MRDIPIIFSGSMVRALLNGHKTQTRRRAWRGDEENLRNLKPTAWSRVDIGDRLWVRENFRWSAWDEDGDFWVTYEADKTRSGCLFPDEGKSQNLMEKLSAKLDRAGVPVNQEHYQSTEALGITPCIHMPRWASRLTLVVTGMKIEPLQDISNEDAIAEGVQDFRASWSAKEAAEAFLRGTEAYVETNDGATAQRLYYLLWSKLHGAESWKADPEVVVLTFTVHKQNIDALPKMAAA
jgi:hypothetical protein